MRIYLNPRIFLLNARARYLLLFHILLFFGLRNSVSNIIVDKNTRFYIGAFGDNAEIGWTRYPEDVGFTLSVNLQALQIYRRTSDSSKLLATFMY